MRYAVVGSIILAACAPSSGPSADVTPTVAFNWDSAGVLTQSIPCDTPVVIKASNEQRGVRMEYEFLARHYPGYKRGGQALAEHKGHMVDILDFTGGDDQPYSVCFDISSFFGKF